jgi:hypothetical protein
VVEDGLWFFDENANLSTKRAAMKTAILVATGRHPENFFLIIIAEVLGSCISSLVADQEYWRYVVTMLAITRNAFAER